MADHCYDECRYADCHYVGCHVLFSILLNVIMMSVVMLSVVAPKNGHTTSKLLTIIFEQGCSELACMNNSSDYGEIVVRS